MTVTELNRTRLVLIGLENMIWPILFVTFLIFAYLIPEIFFSSRNVRFILFASAGIGLLALAEAICLLSGHFDLSVEAIARFSAIFTALFMQQWFPDTPVVFAIVLIILVGAFIGLLNGVFVGIFGVNPFLQTFAFMIIFGQAAPYLAPLSLTGFPDAYTYLGGGTIGVIPVSVILLLTLFGASWVILRYRPIGVAIYSVGGNKQSAREAGINVTFVVILVYVVSGALSGLAGLVYTGFIGAASPTMAEGALFVAFAAAVIGGVNLFGGRGSILGALGGVLLLGVIQTGLVMVDIPATLVKVVNGVVLFAAILLYTFESHVRRYLLTTD